MSRNNTNPSDVASTRRTQGSGQSRSSNKRAALRRQLEDLRDDVRRMTVEDSRNLKSTQDLIEGMTGSVGSLRGMVEEAQGHVDGLKENVGGLKGGVSGLKEDVRDMMKTVEDSVERTKRDFGKMSGRVSRVTEANTAEMCKEHAELRVEIKEMRKEVELRDEDMDHNFARMLEAATAAVGPAVQAAIQGAAKARQEDRNKA